MLNSTVSIIISSKLVAKNDPWKKLRSPNICSHNHSDIPSHLSAVNVINNTFVDNIAQFAQNNNRNGICSSEFNFTLVTHSEIEDVLNQMKNSSAGLDDLGTSFLKLFVSFFSPYYKFS